MRALFRLIFFGLLLVGCHGSVGKTYQVGRDPYWYPLNLRGRAQSVRAFSDDLLEYISKKEEIPVAIYSASGGSLLLALDREWSDGVLTSLPPTPENLAVYDFSEVYLYLGPVLVVPQKSTATSLDSMENSLVGIVGSPNIITDLARVPYLLMKPYATVPSALNDLALGKIQGAIVEALEAYSYVADVYSGVLKVATPPLNDLGLRLIVLKGTNQELLKRFNAGLKRAIKNGTYDDLAREWQLNLNEGPQLIEARAK